MMLRCSKSNKKAPHGTIDGSTDNVDKGGQAHDNEYVSLSKSVFNEISHGINDDTRLLDAEKYHHYLIVMSGMS